VISWPEDLVSDIARRRSVLFLGAGVSKNAQNKLGDRPKDWEEFLRLLCGLVPEAQRRAEIEECLAASDYLTACELARKYLRPDRFKSELLKEFSDKAFEAAPIHDDIASLDSRYVLTTNFDKVYENRANQLQQNTVLVKSYYDEDIGDLLRRSQRAVLKVHGTIDAPDRTVFTRSDYAKMRTKHAHFYRLLESLFLTHTFVFLGASMRDPDIQLLLEDYAYRFAGSRPHYMVMPSGSITTGKQDVLEESMNLRALTYDPANHHRELAQSLAALRVDVESERQSLLQTLNW
jgi:hypothetical protein